MFNNDRITSLKDEIHDLKLENKQLRAQLDVYNRRVRAIDEKERRCDQMLKYLEAQKVELNQALQATKTLRTKINEQLEKYK